MIVLHAAHAGHLCDVAVGSIGYLLLSDATQTVQVVISERFGKMAGVVGPAVQVTCLNVGVVGKVLDVASRSAGRHTKICIAVSAVQCSRDGFGGLT